MRRQLAEIILAASVLIWCVWCGGQYFNEARVAPKLLSDPPRSVVVYNSLSSDQTLPFFFPLNPLIFLLPLAATFVGWKYARAARRWMILTTVIGFGVSLVSIFYLAALIASISKDAGNVAADEIIRRAEIWRLATESGWFLIFSDLCVQLSHCELLQPKRNIRARGFPEF